MRRRLDCCTLPHLAFFLVLLRLPGVQGWRMPLVDRRSKGLNLLENSQMTISDNNHRIMVALDKDLIGWLDKIADERDRSRAYVMQSILQQYRRRIESQRKLRRQAS